MSMLIVEWVFIMVIIFGIHIIFYYYTKNTNRTAFIQQTTIWTQVYQPNVEYNTFK